MEAPSLHVVHASAGRLRLRVEQPGTLGRDALGELGRKIGAYEGVHEVRTSERTGSILVLFAGELDALLDYVRGLSGVAVAHLPGHAPMSRLARALEETEERLVARTRGAVSLGTLTFAATLAAGVFQTGKGRLLPAGLTLLEYALTAMRREAERERAELRIRT